MDAHMSRFLSLFLLLSVIWSLNGMAQELTGRVVSISDGDTLTVLVNRQQVKVRLAEIDTPEKRQPFGTRSRQALADLVFGEQVRVDVIDRDRYGRTVGRVYAGGVDVNAQLVQQGAAWVYRQYAKDPERRALLLELEDEAKQAKRGLWRLPKAQQIPPWDWRRGKKTTRSRAAPAPSTVMAQKPSHCGTKRYCKHMTSCQEARFYLSSCGLSRLDRDGDGVPCEAICR
jgi:endonuclease YncB( thermonuclease family)